MIHCRVDSGMLTLMIKSDGPPMEGGGAKNSEYPFIYTFG